MGLGNTPSGSSAFGNTNNAFASLGMIGTAAAGVAKAIGAKGEANALSSAGLYRAAILNNNAQLALRNADMTMAAGGVAAQQQQLKTRANVGQIEAAQGASNVDVGTGSNVKVRAGATELGTLDAMTTLSNAAREAYGFTVTAQGDTEQAALATAEAKQAGPAGTMEALGSILSSAASVGDQYQKWKTLAGSGSGTQTAQVGSTQFTPTWGASYDNSLNYNADPFD